MNSSKLLVKRQVSLIPTVCLVTQWMTQQGTQRPPHGGISDSGGPCSVSRKMAAMQLVSISMCEGGEVTCGEVYLTRVWEMPPWARLVPFHWALFSRNWHAFLCRALRAKQRVQREHHVWAGSSQRLGSSRTGCLGGMNFELCACGMEPRLSPNRT